MLKDAYDVVIIGSGFGGSVLACRLATAQRKKRGTVSVCVLERGKRYNRGEFPRSLSNPRLWWWRHRGERGYRGFLDFRRFENISVLQGAGVGGTSLIYLDVQIDVFPKTLDMEENGRRLWPARIPDVAALEPYYKRVERMLHPTPIPDPPLKALALKAGAEGAGLDGRFRLVDLAVYWGKEAPERGVLRDDPYDFAGTHGIAGPPQVGCAYCGECFIGCNTHSKNTVDLNYLWLAQKLGAEIYSQHRVLAIEPSGQRTQRRPDHYTVRFKDLRWGLTGEVRARTLVLAAGALGSTELLLRSRDGYRAGRNRVDRTLPELSEKLGHRFSGNGDFGALAFETNRVVDPMTGPTITAAIDCQSELDGLGFLIEDGGFPDLLRARLRRLPGGFAMGRRILGVIRRLAGKAGRRTLVEEVFELLDFETVRDALPYLAMGIDAADGRMKIDEEGNLQIDWDNSRSMKFFRTLESALRRVTESPAPGLDGNLMVNPTWSSQKHLITVHPLGGCPMGDDVHHGVVGDDGEVFNYPGLFVADGAIVPTALGPNPSKTIAALAERIADSMIARGEAGT